MRVIQSIIIVIIYDIMFPKYLFLRIPLTSHLINHTRRRLDTITYFECLYNWFFLMFKKYRNTRDVHAGLIDKADDFNATHLMDRTVRVKP